MKVQKIEGSNTVFLIPTKAEVKLGQILNNKRRIIPVFKKVRVLRNRVNKGPVNIGIFKVAARCMFCDKIQYVVRQSLVNGQGCSSCSIKRQIKYGRGNSPYPRTEAKN